MAYKDIRDIASFGVGGLLAASLYQAINIVWTRRMGMRLTSIPTDALHQDAILNNLFVELENSVKEYDPIAFVRAIDAADRLVFLRLQLQSGRAQPIIQDGIEAFLVHRRCGDSLRRLLLCIEKSMSPRTVVGIQGIFTRISEVLDEHLSAIMTLTAEEK